MISICLPPKFTEETLKAYTGQTLAQEPRIFFLIAQMIQTVKVDQLIQFPCVSAMYGFLCGTMAEVYPVYLSKSGPPEKRSTKSWGQDAPRDDNKESNNHSKANTTPVATTTKKPKRPSLKRKGTMML